VFPGRSAAVLIDQIVLLAALTHDNEVAVGKEIPVGDANGP
jgi:hypothetical protein